MSLMSNFMYHAYAISNFAAFTKIFLLIMTVHVLVKRSAGCPHKEMSLTH